MRVRIGLLARLRSGLKWTFSSLLPVRTTAPSLRACRALPPPSRGLGGFVLCLGRFAGLASVRGKEVAALDLVEAVTWPTRGRALPERHPQQQLAPNVVGAPASRCAGR